MFCPALTDGSIGDMLFFMTYRNPGLVIDIVQDIRIINDLAMKVRPPSKTGMIVLGGGVCKHHVANANLMRNGADFAVYINTAQARLSFLDLQTHKLILSSPGLASSENTCLRPAVLWGEQREKVNGAIKRLLQEFDGSDSGARPDEAVSWGKIRPDAKPVKARAGAHSHRSQSGTWNALRCAHGTERMVGFDRNELALPFAQVYGDATILFPLLVAQTFAKHWEPRAE